MNLHGFRNMHIHFNSLVINAANRKAGFSIFAHKNNIVASNPVMLALVTYMCQASFFISSSVSNPSFNCAFSGYISIKDKTGSVYSPNRYNYVYENNKEV